MYWMEYKFKI
uniref:Uncharacterized protein n=1 Tax=Triatoma infestans TaxID=30076 RepID=A0A170XUV9_TRIIF